MILDVAVLRNDRIKKVVPFGFFLLLCYVDFASFYSVGYREVYKNSRGVAISLWTILSILQVFVLFYWILMFHIGPGKAPNIEPFDIYNQDKNSVIPDYFQCDENGYPFHCSTCKSLMPARSFHSNDMNYCVLKFDHYCSWIGTAIGEANYIAFLKYLLFLVLQHITHIVYAACYTRQNINHGSININFVALFIISVFILLLTFSLLASHVRYVALNRTTLDDITRNQAKRYYRWKIRNKGKRVKNRHHPRKENGFRFINIKHHDSRVVIKHSVMYDNYNMGFKNNFINLVYTSNRNSSVLMSSTSYSNEMLLKSIIILMSPLVEIPHMVFGIKNYNNNSNSRFDTIYSTYEFHSPKLDSQFIDYLNSQIEKGNYKTPSYLSSPKSENTISLNFDSNLDKEDLSSEESSTIV